MALINELSNWHKQVYASSNTKMHLYVIDVIDISRSLYSQLQELVGRDTGRKMRMEDNNANNNTQPVNTQPVVHCRTPSTVYKVVLSEQTQKGDSKHLLVGMDEHGGIHGLDLNTPPGTRITLHKVPVLRGVLQLTRDNTQVVIEHSKLSTEQLKQARINRLKHSLGMIAVDNQKDEQINNDQITGQQDIIDAFEAEDDELDQDMLALVYEAEQSQFGNT